MSADSHTACPKCYPDLIGAQGITDTIASDRGYETQVRENYTFYIRDGLTLVSEYHADCWTCGWHFEVTTESSLM